LPPCPAFPPHVAAYAAIRKSYKALAKQIGEDNRLDTAAAVTSFGAMVKACIDHKSNVTTGGHNIMIDVIPNDIAARCLDMGRKMLDEETAWLTTDPEKNVRTSRPRRCAGNSFRNVPFARASNSASQPAIRRVASLCVRSHMKHRIYSTAPRGRGDSPWAI